MENIGKAGTARDEKVVNCLYPKPDAIFRLICFPWAGGGSFYFAKWGEKMPDSVEVHSIRLAGRECRSEEPFATDIYQIVEETVRALLPIIQNKPFAFFGHSMGSYIAFMTALHLKEKYKLEPIHLFVSSVNAPHAMLAHHQEGKAMSDEQIHSLLLRFGGTQMDVLNDKDFSEYYIHIMKADIHIIANYIFKAPSEPVLSCDLTCFLGTEDVVKDTKAWKDVTSGRLNTLMRPGNHFYIKEPANEAFIRNYITRCLELSLF
ncbi:S-acyl fatty acid synthase thioesterase, medium chain [Phyllostomus hastatus]|uniref:S-acyl fatty acid synthase thioesterase, medium chain n=1 Tax=Phyllostomus hastatus TaxID=9423 RepID=UPI001E67F286|nr:S-acyl fatty acid synthase thioesterase, medium chain [Phyllostomus hastatus]